MTTEILLAPAATGKTEQAIERLLNVVEEPFAAAWVLLASARQEDAFRQRLLQTGGKQVYFNIEFFDFYKLYKRLLNIAGQPVRSLDQTGRFRLLRAVIEGLQANHQLEYFKSIANTPGFVRVVASFIDELKQGVIPADAFAATAELPKDRELSLIYTAYQERLIAHKLVDREGEGWLALDALRKDDNRSIAHEPVQLKLPLKMLLVDGFDLLTPLQARLVARLSGRAGLALVTLTTVTERESTIGRRFKQALERLIESHTLEQQSEPVVRVLSGAAAEDGRAPDMRHLLANIFRLGVSPVQWQNNVRWLEAPDTAREVSAVLRRVKRLLLDGVSPDEIMIALRDWTGYNAHLISMTRTYGLPMALHYGEPLAQNAAIIALMNLLQLHGGDFKRRDLLDALRSPYFQPAGLDSTQIDELERISHALLVTGGRSMWLEALDEAPRVSSDEEYDAEPIIDDAVAQQLKASLSLFFDAVTPPEEAAVDDYVYWIERLIGPDVTKSPDNDETITDDATYRLHMLGSVRRDAPSYIVSRDIAAMQTFKRVLRGLLSGQELLKALGEDKPVAWDIFFSDLRAAVEASEINTTPSRSGRVLVTTAANARGLPHKHLFILGLSEGLFPARQPEDPLYTDSERQRFKVEKNIPLLTRSERAADDGLFYELIGLPRESLTLSRPYLQDGKLWIESHLWRATRLVFDAPHAVERIRAGMVIGQQEVASLEEAALAVSQDLNGGVQQANGLYNWMLQSQRGYWDVIRLGRTVEARRMSRSPHDQYSGRLRDAVLIEQVAHKLGRSRPWSASQLGEMGQCGFRFFAKRLLRLEALEEPEEGTDALVLGSIYHKILENTYNRLGASGAAISAEYVDSALVVLGEEAEKVLDSAPQDMHFRADAVWEGEKRVIRRRLEALLRKDFSEGSPLNAWSRAERRPYKMEASFGADVPLYIDLPGGEQIRVRGYIDRIDRQGELALVVDYKSGTTPISTNEMKIGRNFQMMLYLQALPHVLANDPDAPQQVAGGMFWHIRNGAPSGQVTPADEAIEQARVHLVNYLHAGRAGDFAAIATKLEQGKCARYCEFSQMCRMSNMSRGKR
ncbi:MAG: PD-(D/E)XK nuclease family protein [Anaerolineae bacterium]